MSISHLPPPATRRRATPAGPVALAILVLVLAFAGTVWLVAAAPEPADGPRAEPLTAAADYAAYGGDAYTGIQNAAADTANAVVAGANAANELASALHEESAAADAAHWAHLYRGLAVLLVLLGLANLGRALQRPRPGA